MFSLLLCFRLLHDAIMSYYAGLCAAFSTHPMLSVKGIGAMKISQTDPYWLEIEPPFGVLFVGRREI